MSQQSFGFSHIPSKEKKQKWFLLLEPLIQARNLRENCYESKLIKTMNHSYEWKNIQSIIELAINNCKNAESIFAAANRIRTSQNPDQVIDEIFAELRALRFLINNDAKNITYNKKNNIDFTCHLGIFIKGVEVTYINGPDFKTQSFSLDSKRLINLLKSKYEDKKKQLIKHGYNYSNCIVILVSDLLEMYEPWLAHDLIDGLHPLEYFVLNTEIPTIILSSTIYAPSNIF